MEDSPPEIRLTKEEVTDICRLGQQEKCCAFIAFDPNGFSCLRATSLCETILQRVKDGKMSAKGEGGWENCLWKKQCDAIASSETNQDINKTAKE